MSTHKIQTKAPVKGRSRLQLYRSFTNWVIYFRLHELPIDDVKRRLPFLSPRTMDAIETYNQITNSLKELIESDCKRRTEEEKRIRTLLKLNWRRY